MDLYLITGFLGAGKTTFLKNLICHFRGTPMHLVINEFGREGVDGDLVRTLGATLSEINNGSIFCACRLDKFEDTLDEIVGGDHPLVLVEASGLSDPTNVRKVLDQPKYQGIHYRGSICLIDGARFQKVATTARVVPRQVKISSLGLVNKADLVDEAQLQAVMDQVKSLNPAIVLHPTTMGQLDGQWLDDLRPDICVEAVENNMDITLQKATVTLSPNIPLERLEKILRLLGEDSYRIKGFVPVDGTVYLADCVGGYVKFAPHEGASSNLHQIVVLAGAGMSLRKLMKEVKSLYGDDIQSVSYGT